MDMLILNKEKQILNFLKYFKLSFLEYFRNHFPQKEEADSDLSVLR